MWEYEEVPPIDLDVESIAVGAPTQEGMTLVVTQKDKSVVVLNCNPGVRFCPGKRQRAFCGPFGEITTVYDLDENNKEIPGTHWPK